ncbi:MAG: hypothetical protein II736_01705 [Clostridia bacterium]|nr:hypothetical protein [Clostridia bacterium]
MNSRFRIVISILALVLAAVVASVSLVSCSVRAVSNSGPDDDGDAPTEVVFPEKGSSGLLGFAEFASNVFAHNVPELYAKAGLVVFGTVVGESQYRKEGSGLEAALSDVLIEKVWKGDLKEGDTVTVTETGWRLEDGRTLSLGGEPILEEGEKVVLFLGSAYEGRRAVVNSFQGKLFLDKSGVLHTYGYYSDEFPGGFFEDVGEEIPFADFQAILDGLSK